MSYLLDTSTCVAIIRPRTPLVRRRAADALARGERLMVSSVVLHELWYGVHKSARIQENTAKLLSFLSSYVEICPLDAQDARTAGEVRAELERRGLIIGAYDTLIAGHCLNRGFTFVTGNIAEFKRVKGLRLEDWTK